MVASQKRSRAAFQFYPADFLASSKVARMSTMEIGAYFTLLCYAWTDNGLPAQIDQLAKLLRMPSGRFKKLWAGVLSECFEERQGRLVNPRQERQRKELEDYISACERGGRRSADSRSKRYGSSQPVHSDSRSEPRSERRSEHRSGVEVAPNTSSSSSSVQQESLASLAPAGTGITRPWLRLGLRVGSPLPHQHNSPLVAARSSGFESSTQPSALRAWPSGASPFSSWSLTALGLTTRPKPAQM